MRCNWHLWIPDFSSLNPVYSRLLPFFSSTRSRGQKWYGLMRWWLLLATSKRNSNLVQESCVNCCSRQRACRTSNVSKESSVFPNTSKSPRFVSRRKRRVEIDFNASFSCEYEDQYISLFLSFSTYSLCLLSGLRLSAKSILSFLSSLLKDLSFRYHHFSSGSPIRWLSFCRYATSNSRSFLRRS